MFERTMREQFGGLAVPLQVFHRLQGTHELHGWVETAAPASFLARLMGRLLGTPQVATRGPIRFVLQASPDSEVWTRHFPDRVMTSTMRRCDTHVEECLGPSRLAFVLLESEGRLVMQLKSMRFLGVPCPAWLMPTIQAQESAQGNQLHFQVHASLPWVGTVAGYSGHLVIPMGDSA